MTANVWKRAFGILSLAAILVASPMIARADSDEATAEEDVAAAEESLASPQYVDASLGGIRQYMAFLSNNDLMSYEVLLPEYRRLQRKKNQAIIGAAVLGFSGTFLTMSSLSIMRTKTLDVNGNVHRQINESAALCGISLIAAAFIVYDLIAPSRVDLLDFVNRNNVIRGDRPMRYDAGVFFEF